MKLGDLIYLPYDRQVELTEEFESVFRAAWSGDYDWIAVIKHFSDMSITGAVPFFRGFIIGKQFAKDRMIRKLNAIGKNETTEEMYKFLNEEL